MPFMIAARAERLCPSLKKGGGRGWRDARAVPARRALAASLALFAAACADESAAVAESAAEAPAAGAHVWTLDPAASRLVFAATQTGERFEGRFEDFSADIAFDPDDPESASIAVTVDLASARTGDRQRDAALPGRDWFHVREHPTARFVSDAVAKTGENAYEARGTLTIRGVSKEVALPFTLTIDGDRAHAEGSLVIDRTDFGVGQGEFATGQWVGLDVDVSFVVEATRAGG
ncbi:YceI family protein [Amphiplicatus metriothermophilus]|uniref:Polyisoprenoid-binding protein YceI n=1 Tax=Amphiplicatus metriothermophilus TaxID=1519374 RepID=A0A239PXK9_9PROT|nr:YceI family protein [Amphiplicatus metriothermophilus]MBB5519915.1 polyisoprenoid-binding protein YceI [Amphiplicatus metriothermophilus]SNT74818.1 Polyisoprenoid-binding protein YceI [Amphiplicatus metriothermophilus]